MTTLSIKTQPIFRFFNVITKFALILSMIASIVILFFVGSGVIKPSKSWQLITKEESMK